MPQNEAHARKLFELASDQGQPGADALIKQLDGQDVGDETDMSAAHGETMVNLKPHHAHVRIGILINSHTHARRQPKMIVAPSNKTIKMKQCVPEGLTSKVKYEFCHLSLYTGALHHTLQHPDHL